MHTEVDKLSNHVIVCGYGRIGIALAQSLKDGGAAFVIIEQNERRVGETRDAGYLCPQGDATNKATLEAAGVGRARALATVLSNDAVNVFITLNARNLNRSTEIIARGDAVSTERKLLHAGANKVVLPTHIGAERIAEIILFPETSRFIRDSKRMSELERTLRNLGLAIEVVVVPEKGALTGLTIEEIEQRARGAFFIVQVNRRDCEPITAPNRPFASGRAMEWLWSAARAEGSARFSPRRRKRCAPAAPSISGGIAGPRFAPREASLGCVDCNPGGRARRIRCFSISRSGL